MTSRWRWSILVGWMALLVGLNACTGNKVYDTYAHTPINGWEKNDTLVFHLQRMRNTAEYVSDLGLRITTDYPFMGLTLIIDQMIYPSKVHYVDTLNCQLMDKSGNSLGIGLSYYQFNFPITSMPLHQGDSVIVRIRHDMKREILPGISDIGYQLRRK